MADLRERQETALARVLCFSDVHHPQPDKRIVRYLVDRYSPKDAT